MTGGWWAAAPGPKPRCHMHPALPRPLLNRRSTPRALQRRPGCGRAHPDVQVHVYDADHGFNCDQRGSYDEASALVARDRTLAFFAKHVG